MSRWDAFKARLRELLSPTPDEEQLETVEQLEADTRARTEWVRNHRHPEGL